VIHPANGGKAQAHSAAVDRERLDDGNYSLSTLSAHSTNTTRSGGVTKRAFLS
jgi:hypothetical protein